MCPCRRARSGLKHNPPSYPAPPTAPLPWTSTAGAATLLPSSAWSKRGSELLPTGSHAQRGSAIPLINGCFKPVSRVSPLGSTRARPRRSQHAAP
jgi:hypothetical protein